MTLSYVKGSSSVALLEQTIGESLRRTVERFPHREALVVPHQDYRATYAELWRQVDRAARAFMARGVGKGDRLGIWARNRHEWVVTQFATARIGAILVTINPAYQAAEVDYALAKAGVSVLVMADGPVRPAGVDTIVLEADWDAFLAAGDEVGDVALLERELTLEPRDAINIQFTSGTTGHPKGATLSHHNILNNGFFVAEGLKLKPGDKLCIPVPLYHCFGMVMGNLGCLTHGATMVYPSDTFDPLATLQAIADEKCMAVYGVPTMFIAMLEHPRFDSFDLKSLRTGIMAGSPCPIEVMKRVQSQMNMHEVTIAYGMTETSPVSTQCATDDPVERRVSTVGQVLPHIEIKIVDGEGKTVLRGTSGEFCTRG
jgi:fatty-acyl-CoA synthase